MEDYKPSKVVVVILIMLILASSYYFFTTASHRFSQPSKGTLTIGTNTPFKPFEYKNGDNIIGFDMELGQKIGEKLERKVIIKDFSDFPALFPALETGSIDMVISSITITTSRDEVMDFSEPYYNASQALLTAKKSNINLNMNLDPKDFTGLKIGYQEKTTSQSYIETNLDDTVLKTSFGDLNMAIQSLRFDMIDGILLDEPVAKSLTKDYPDLVISGIVDTKEQYGVVVKQGDPQKMLPEVNAVIQEMKKNGEYDQLIKKYFGGN